MSDAGGGPDAGLGSDAVGRSGAGLGPDAGGERLMLGKSPDDFGQPAPRYTQSCDYKSL